MPAILHHLRRTVRWFLPAVMLAAAPKCLLCLLAYIGVGAALGFGGPEICGAVTGSPLAWTSILAWSGVPLGLVLGWFMQGRCFHRRRAHTVVSPRAQQRLTNSRQQISPGG